MTAIVVCCIIMGALLMATGMLLTYCRWYFGKDGPGR